jgi:hypothetical protein
LRSQGDFYLHTHFQLNRGLYYWVATRELLPAAWRWFTACVQHSTAVNDTALVRLAGSLLQRFDRALEARDKVHVALNQVQGNDLRDDALAALDTVLVYFMAAFDVAARLAHQVLSIAGDEYQAAWQQRRPGGWWGKVNAIEPTLAAVVEPATTGDHVLTVVRLLRNSVHGAALQGIAYAQGGGAQQTLVALPPQDETDLLTAMDATGGRGSWGVGQTGLLGTLVDPGMAVEQLFAAVPPVLNEIMDRTPVERLQGVNLSAADSLPPAGTGSNPFQGWMRRSIRLQLGL